MPFSLDRDIGKPFPVCYEAGFLKLIPDEVVTLPAVDAPLPTKDGEPPLES